MPGFKIVGGESGNVPGNMIETRSRHRWIFQVLQPFDSQGLLILKEAARPHFTFEEPEMHHDQEKAYFAGKQSWEATKMVWYDAEQPDLSAKVYEWLKKVVDLLAANVSVPSAYKALANLQMTSAAGTPTETWAMYGSWPQDVNWNALDYADTEIQTIEASMRYDRAIRQ